MTSRRAVESSWSSVEMPVVDATRCTGCGWCVEACPTECLAMHASLPCLPRPRDCVSCSVCALVCPATAIRMEKSDEA